MESLLVNGLIGGLIATVVMTVFQMGLGGDNPPPTSILWSKYIGSEGPEAYLPQGMVLHFIYGIGAGGAFGVGVYLLELEITDLLIAAAVGLGYGVVLFIIAAVLWMKVVLQLEADGKTIGMFLFFHLVYGIVLGLWMSAELITL